MPVEPIALSRPWFDVAEQENVRAALQGRVAGDGPFCRKVEARLAQMLEVRRVLLTTSCTHALELALMALGVGPGHEVICPSFTFVSTANAVLRTGATPVLADIEEHTLGLDPEDTARRINPRTIALMPVHYAGTASDIDGIIALARRERLFVVEDAAQTLGATLEGRALGTFGDAGCFSFHETKNVTCGEGGALVLRDPAVTQKAEIAREKGTNRSAFLRGEVDKYTWIAPGSSFVLSDVLAAILDAQLDKRDEIERRRAQVISRYRAGLAEWAQSHGVTMAREDARCRPNHHIFYLLYPSAETRDRALRSLRSSGIEASFHYVPLHSSPFGQRLSSAGDRFPVAERIAATLLRLPLHPLLSESDIDRVIDAVSETA